MKGLRLRKKNKQLFRFWCSYLVLMVLFMGCILLLCARAFALLEKNVETNTFRNMTQGMEILDNEISTLKNVVIDVQSYKYYTYIRAMDSELEAKDFYALMEMQQKLADSTKFLSFVRECMLYFPNGILFLEDSVFAIQAQDSYERLHTQRHGKLEDWLDDLGQGKYTHAFLEAEYFYDRLDGEFEGIVYVHAYTRANQKESPLFVSVFPVQSLLEIWRLEELEEIARITILNSKDGTVLYGNDRQVSGGTSEFVVNSRHSSLSVEVSIPNSFFYSQLKGIIIPGAFYIAGVSAIAVVVSVGLAYKNTSRHTALNEEISHWMLREQILNGLDGKQLEEFRVRYGDFRKPFRFLVIHLTRTEWNISAAEVKEVLSACDISFSFFSRIRPNLFVMLGAGGGEEEAYRQALEPFLESARQKWECDCLVSVSSPHDSLEDLKELYRNTWCNLQCFSERKIILQKEVEEFEKNNLRDFNIMENIRLTDMILSGNDKAAWELVKSQWEKARTTQADVMFEQLFYMQFTVLTSVALRLDYDISTVELTCHDSISEIEEKMIELTGQLCEYVRSKKEQNKNDVPRKIIEYIEENYSNPEFYMITLVEEFGLSDKTIAKLIKGYQNKTFSEYLEELRLRKARALLEDTQLGIGYIATASGFGSENTFFKVFKRKFGISPSIYRNNKQIMTDKGSELGRS